MYKENINNEEQLFVKLNITFQVELLPKIVLSLNAAISMKIARKNNVREIRNVCTLEMY